MTPGWVRENEKRVRYLERLYLLDGRDAPSHPMHRLYTGLYQNRARVLMELDRHDELKCPF